MSGNHDYVERTPGSWNATRLGEIMGPFGASKIARLCGPNMEGNARLIAAAPDLLAALKEARAFITTLLNSGLNEAHDLLVNHGNEVELELQEAIIKAEGRGHE